MSRPDVSALCIRARCNRTAAIPELLDCNAFAQRPESPMMPSDHSRQPFERTHWSMVMQADAPQATDARDALVELCVRYWYPIYAYVRRAGTAPAIAQDITRSFLQHLFRALPRTAELRRRRDDFATTCWRACALSLPSDWRSRLVARSSPNWPSRRRISNCATSATTPARNRPSRPTSRVSRSSCSRARSRGCARRRARPGASTCTRRLNRSSRLIHRQPKAGRTGAASGYALALIVMALKRLRQRFRELIDAELADTVASADELLAEQQALYAVLRECG